jgi:hypothetical protein
VSTSARGRAWHGVAALEAGVRFGRLVVLQDANAYAVSVQCDCGTVKVVRREHLRRGFTNSCGCLRREARETHGLSRHPLFDTWKGMVARCEDPTHRSYRSYGGRGITVCAAWHDPAAFIADIERDLGPRPPGMTLDRIDNDGPYGPGKVRWATRSQQQTNKRPAAEWRRP